MINLLPPDVKQEYRYARFNYRLMRWCLALAGVVVGITLIASSGLVIVKAQSADYQAQINDANVDLARQNNDQIQSQVTAVSSNIRLMANVLSKQVLFSQLLNRLGSLTPSDVKLTNLSVSQEADAIQVTATARTYEAATQLQANLSDPDNRIFSKADIVSISCEQAATATTTSDYPCTVDIKALFLENNPFLFINTGKAKS